MILKVPCLPNHLIILCSSSLFPHRNGREFLLGGVEKTNSTQMQRISSPDLNICCMQEKKKKVVQISLHHPHSALGSEAPSHENRTGAETPPQSHAYEESIGFVWLLKPLRVFSLLKFRLCLCVSSSLSTWEPHFSRS